MRSLMRVADVPRQLRRACLVLSLVAGVGGAASILRLPISLYPHVDFPRIDLKIDAGSRPAPQMEIEVTRKVENAVRAVRGVRNVRSITSRGSADVSVDFDWGTNMALALLDSEAQLGQLLSQLPSGTTYTTSH